jgi:hypothetical protein
MNNFSLVDVDIGTQLINLQSLPPIDLGPTAPPMGVRELMQSKAQESAISTDEVIRRTRKAMKRGLPGVGMLRRYTTPSREAVICGGGPSLNDELPRLRELARRGIPIYTVNKTHDHLVSLGITPYAQVLLDPNPWVAEYTKPVKGVRYLLAGQVCDAVFEQFTDYPVFLWHAAVDAENGRKEPIDTLEREFKNQEWTAHPGPTTVGLRTILVAQGIHGSTHFHMFGFDSSRKENSLHAYEKRARTDVPDLGITLRCYDGREATFQTNLHMMMQTTDFERMIAQEMPKLVKQGKMPFTHFKFYGSGLLPTLASMYGMHADREMNEKWKRPDMG